jgi:hypothetical protein
MTPIAPEHAKRVSSTKRGPGRYHRDGAPKANAARRRPGGCGRFGLGVTAMQTKRNRDAIEARRKVQA